LVVAPTLPGCLLTMYVIACSWAAVAKVLLTLISVVETISSILTVIVPN
jgi:hypothetical protein